MCPYRGIKKHLMTPLNSVTYVVISIKTWNQVFVFNNVSCLHAPLILIPWYLILVPSCYSLESSNWPFSKRFPHQNSVSTPFLIRSILVPSISPSWQYSYLIRARWQSNANKPILLLAECKSLYKIYDSLFCFTSLHLLLGIS